MSVAFYVSGCIGVSRLGGVEVRERKCACVPVGVIMHGNVRGWVGVGVRKERKEGN
jgi:hypothetical protein